MGANEQFIYKGFQKKNKLMTGQSKWPIAIEKKIEMHYI
jgi:hypothetical protein